MESTLIFRLFKYTCWLQKIRLECQITGCGWQEWHSGGQITDLIAAMSDHIYEKHPEKISEDMK